MRGDRRRPADARVHDRGDGARLLVLHDDAAREYAYGPARGLPASTVGTFNQALDDEGARQGWIVVGMKHDWNRMFSFDASSVETARRR